jgi:succinylglutamic semialdehyde dehydrogenase
MRDHFIAGRWVEGSGRIFHAANPTGDGPPAASRIAHQEEVLAACNAADAAFPGWRQTPYEERVRVADEFAAVVTRRKRELAEAISGDTGKPRWEAEQEVETVVRKVSLSQAAYQQRTGSSIHEAAPGTTAR